MQILENLVFLHEKRKGSDIKYFSDGTYEVDFVVKNNLNQYTLIQVSKDISGADTLKGEETALLKASEIFKSDDLLIITEHTERKYESGGKTIQVIPMWKYLMT